ncbi:MAG: response regulator [Deltaproteobacteria bacterium]|nr:response regulator [Deltaproteobacteria bacterium]
MKILIVDDEKENLYLLETLLKGNDYEVVSATNGAEALEKLRAERFGMIIADILMPVMDGFQLCREVKGDDKLKDSLFIFYTATYIDEKDEEFALKLGADKFIRKPAEPDEFIKTIKSLIRDVEKGKVEPRKPISEEKEVFKLYSERLVKKLEKKMLDLEREITERKHVEKELQHSLEKVRKILGGIIQTMALIVEIRDPYTAGHQRRVMDLACAIAREMGISGEQIEGLRLAASIHDIGKIHIPAEILSKPEQLSEIEFDMIKTHPRVGYDILKTVEFPWPVAQIVLQHHERQDGSGYPQGLSGDDILLETRILAVADVVEAMASHRPYRAARGIGDALEEILHNKGILYDPKVVDACLKLFYEKEFKF